jgi:hypothetical protein
MLSIFPERRQRALLQPLFERVAFDQLKHQKAAAFGFLRP